MKKIIIFALIILLVITVFFFIRFNSAINPNKQQNLIKDTVIIGIESNPVGFSPWMPSWDTNTQNINFNIFNPLVEVRDNKIVPLLAESWENPSKDVWRFHLKSGVKFSNGDDFTAEDVKFSLDYILNNKENPYHSLLGPIKKVEVVDNYTVDIFTNQPYPSLLTNLFEIAIVSKNYVQKVDASGGEKLPIGTGAYKLKEYIKGDRVVMEKFDDYWGKKSQIKTAIFRIFSDAEKAADALAIGDIDIALQIPTSKYNTLKNNTNIKLLLANQSKVVYLGFDFRKINSYGFGKNINPTSDLRVRKAMYQAIDIDEIIEKVLNGLAEPASQFVTPNIFGFNPKIKRLSYNIEESKKLLTEAGFPDGFKIEMDCVTDLDVNYPNYCKEIVRQLALVNIQVKLNLQPKDIYFEKLDKKNTSFFLLGWGIDIGDAQEIFDNILFTVNNNNKRGNYNHGYYSNSRVDQLGEQSASLMNPAERLKDMQDAFEIAMNDVVWIPLTMPKVISGGAANLDFKIPSQGKIILEDIKSKN